MELETATHVFAQFICPTDVKTNKESLQTLVLRFHPRLARLFLSLTCRLMPDPHGVLLACGIQSLGIFAGFEVIQELCFGV